MMRLIQRKENIYKYIYYWKINILKNSVRQNVSFNISNDLDHSRDHWLIFLNSNKKKRRNKKKQVIAKRIRYTYACLWKKKKISRIVLEEEKEKKRTNPLVVVVEKLWNFLLLLRLANDPRHLAKSMKILSLYLSFIYLSIAFLRDLRILTNRIDLIFDKNREWSIKIERMDVCLVEGLIYMAGISNTRSNINI